MCEKEEGRWKKKRGGGGHTYQHPEAPLEECNREGNGSKLATSENQTIAYARPA